MVGGGYPQRFMRLTDFYWLFFGGSKSRFRCDYFNIRYFSINCFTFLQVFSFDIQWFAIRNSHSSKFWHKWLVLNYTLYARVWKSSMLLCTRFVRPKLSAYIAKALAEFLSHGRSGGGAPQKKAISGLPVNFIFLFVKFNERVGGYPPQLFWKNWLLTDFWVGGTPGGPNPYWRHFFTVP